MEIQVKLIPNGHLPYKEQYFKRDDTGKVFKISKDQWFKLKDNPETKILAPIYSQ